LVYLNCAIKESLRLYPPVPYISREAKENAVIGGKNILKGCSVAVFIYQIHRDERYFPEPEEYKPERFLKFDSVKNNQNPYTYIPFSAGRRNCIGQRFAMLEIKVILVNILRYFKIECNQNYKDLKPYCYMIFKGENPIKVTLKEREN
jgi:cytochrome P450